MFLSNPSKEEIARSAEFCQETLYYTWWAVFALCIAWCIWTLSMAISGRVYVPRARLLTVFKFRFWISERHWVYRKSYPWEFWLLLIFIHVLGSCWLTFSWLRIALD